MSWLGLARSVCDPKGSMKAHFSLIKRFQGANGVNSYSEPVFHTIHILSLHQFSFDITTDKLCNVMTAMLMILIALSLSSAASAPSPDAQGTLIQTCPIFVVILSCFPWVI